MNSDLLGSFPPPEVRRSAKGKIRVVLGLGIALAGLALISQWQTDLPLSPRYTLRITDNSRLPIPGVVVVHEWGLSVRQHGEDKAATDTKGIVSFPPASVPMSVLHRLAIGVMPSARGMGYENYNSARFRIYLPRGLTIDLVDGGWTQAGNISMMYTNSTGVFIRINDRSRRLLARAARVPNWRSPAPPPPVSPQADHLDLFFPGGINEFELHVHRERPT